MFNSHQSEMCANNAWQKSLKNVFFSFTPTKIKLYTMKVPMESSIFVLQVSLKMSFNMQMSYIYTNRICPKYTQIGLIFSFTPTTKKLYIVKVYMKSNFFCITSFFLNEFEYAHELHTICPNLHRQKHHTPGRCYQARQFSG